MEVKIRKVENGYYVEVEGDDADGNWTQKQYVFSKFYQVQRFVKENLNESKPSN